MEERFTNREITLMFQNISEKLEEHGKTQEQILTQALYTNGRVRKLYLYLTVVGTATVTLLFTNGSELLSFVKIFI